MYQEENADNEDENSLDKCLIIFQFFLFMHYFPATVFQKRGGGVKEIENESPNWLKTEKDKTSS